jgi:PAS domain S-box-containing protein
VEGESKRNELDVGAPGAMQRLISELVQSDTWLRSLVDQSPLGISISHNGITLYVNQACARLFGSFAPADHVGTSQLTRVAPQSRDTVADYIRRREQGEAAPGAYEIMGEPGRERLGLVDDKHDAFFAGVALEQEFVQ